MAFTWEFSALFAKEFANFPTDQQDAVLDFTATFAAHGLADFTKYTGKITPTWNGATVGSAQHAYAKANDLWHYHLGLPHYNYVHGKYATSDWVLHFQWPSKGSHIRLVDVCYHKMATGAFYVPGRKYLAAAPDPGEPEEAATK
ncbi:hypothetical protein PQR39_21150 [Paraburkholderia sediminicola]|uniref:hypothetical protein n=1 Tax=Paraburkholderia sediminicola TaxID=458836 RepID=UPI0038B84B86